MSRFKVLVPPQHVELTTVDQFKAELNLTDANTARDRWIADRIKEASRAIEDEIDHPYARQRVQERFDGTGRETAVLDMTPIVRLDQLEQANCGQLDLTAATLGMELARIDNAEAGILYLADSFPDDAPRRSYLTVDAYPESGARSFQATYWGGWLLRSDDIPASGVTASGSDILLRKRAPWLVGGDVIELAGFPTADGRYRVVERVDDLTIRVDATLPVETAGADAWVEVRTAPAQFERCAVEAVRTWFYERTRDITLQSESIGDWSGTYRARGTTRVGVLPEAVLSALDTYRRWM